MHLSENTVLKRDWIILVAAVSGTTLEYICENNLFFKNLLRSNANFLGRTYHNQWALHLPGGLSQVSPYRWKLCSSVHGHLWTFNPMQNRSWDAFCGTYNPWYCRSYARFARFSNKYHPTTQDFGRLPHPVCGFTGFRPDLPAQAAVCWSWTYFLSKIFLLGCIFCNYSASTKHEW